MNNIDLTLYCDYPIDYQQYYNILFLSAFLLNFFIFFCIKSSVRQRKRLYHHNVFLLARNACK